VFTYQGACKFNCLFLESPTCSLFGYLQLLRIELWVHAENLSVHLQGLLILFLLSQGFCLEKKEREMGRKVLERSIAFIEYLLIIT
jgi:hypothetical protein